MNSPAVENNETAPTAVNAAATPAEAPRRAADRGAQVLKAAVAVAFILLGGALLAANLGLLAPEAERVLGVAWPSALMLVGLGLAVGGDRLWTPEPGSFALERGAAQEAELEANAGTADLRLEALAEGDELARGELPWPGTPRLERVEQRASLRMQPGWGWPAAGGTRGTVALGRGLPWRLDLRASTGNLDLDLRDLALAGLRLRSSLGDVALTLPAAGGAELDLRLTCGDLTVTVPDGLGVKVKLSTGRLAEVAHDERRFIEMGPNELGTPLYAVAAQRCTLTVRLGTGNLRLV